MQEKSKTLTNEQLAELRSCKHPDCAKSTKLLALFMLLAITTFFTTIIGCIVAGETASDRLPYIGIGLTFVLTSRCVLPHRLAGF
jgi:hypothetical protein